MITLHDLIAQYGPRTNPLAVGDKVLFERSEDSGMCSINLGEVKQIIPGGDFKEPTVRVRGVHTFYPDGSHKPFRGRTQWAFPMSHFTRTIGEQLGVHAKRLEERATQIRTWMDTLNQ